LPTLFEFPKRKIQGEKFGNVVFAAVIITGPKEIRVFLVTLLLKLNQEAGLTLFTA
jgi:hypothetical protein